ncbi:hypothetical protein TrST_g2860 [Triparma strigata]|uniref:Association with the SNF1 complex (ASC) domain-containing protein n=1 Tax=Triparma strigata TaxID=1606541 RepID=A0A9W7DU60_9STRA|nr:hypothetical protein TrST_g2860 [Triparma strigata]
MGNVPSEEANASNPISSKSSPPGSGGNPNAGVSSSQQQYPPPPSQFNSSAAPPPFNAQQEEGMEVDPPMPPESDETVPTVFRWEHGGRQVFITGTFNGWSKQIPMHRSGNDFTYIHGLKKGKHAFKFIVDDEWRFAPDQPTVADIEGRINNFIDVTGFTPFHGDDNFESRTLGDSVDVLEESKDKESWSQNIPGVDEYTKEPHPLPPHLRHIILNKAPSLTDTASLPTPQHVALNHLYCTAIKDNMMVLGVTVRFKGKFVTNVYYSPCS